MEKTKLEPYSNQNHESEEAYQRAKKRVKELKGFYWHAFWYLVVNIFIVSMIASNTNNIWSFATFSTPIFWGLGLMFHALAVFGKNFVFSKNWEEKKIREYMDKDKQQWN